MSGSEAVLFVNGGYGTGKTSALDAIGDLLAGAGRPFSLIDVDWFHRSWPPAPDDPENVEVEAANMRSTWERYRRSGPRQLVVSGVLTGRRDVERYEAAFSSPLWPVLLTAEPVIVEARLRGRYPAERGAALNWHLARHRDVARSLMEAGCFEVVVATDALTSGEVASAVLAAFDSRA